jgi:hypothetical protein
MVDEPSLRFRAQPTSPPAALPKRYEQVPDSSVIWTADLDAHGRLIVGVVVEIVAGTIVAETLVYPEAAPSDDELAAYVASHPARVDPGGTRTIRLADRAAAAKLLRSRSYKSGHALVTCDVGPQLVTLAEHWHPGALDRRGRRADWSLILIGLGYLNPQGAYRKYANEPRVLLTNIGEGTCATWSRGKPEPGKLRPKVGPIVDTLNVAAALTGANLTLRETFDMFSVPVPDTSGGPIDQLRARAHAIAALWAAQKDVLDRLGYGLNPAWLVSTGGLVTAMLRDAYLPPLADRLALSNTLLGATASAFYGGRFEAHLTHTPAPAVLADVSSTYPRMFSTLVLGRYLTAETVSTVDVTAKTRDLMGSPDLAERILDPHLWADLGITLIQVRPAGDQLPVKLSDGRSTVASLDLGRDPAWYHWPDIAAAALTGPRSPEIVQAVHLIPRGVIAGLGPVRLPTGRLVDLTTEDIAAVLVAERHRVSQDLSLGEPERDRIVGLLKLTANTLTFGMLARTDRVTVTASTFDHAIAPDGAPLIATTPGVIERPGPYAWLPAAGAVCAAARLILAATITTLEAAGGTWLHCAADSLLIAATHDPDAAPVAVAGHAPVIALPIDKVEEILDRFDPLLCPRGGHAWKREAGWDRPMVGYVTGVNRLGLIDPATDTTAHVTEVGLGGVFADPTGTSNRTVDGHHQWAIDLHTAHLQRQTNRAAPVPAWSCAPALRPGRATSTRQLVDIEHHLGCTLRPYARWVLAHPREGQALYGLPGPASKVDWHRDGQPIRPGRLRSLRDEYLAWAGGLTPRHGLQDPEPVSTRLMWATFIGKEYDGIAARQSDPLAEWDAQTSSYAPIDTWTPILNVARQVGAVRLAQLTGLAPSTIRHALAGRPPSAPTAERIRRALSRDTGVVPEVDGRVCQRAGCGHRITGRKRFCSDRCRKAASRATDALAAVPAEIAPGRWAWTCPTHGPIEATLPACPHCAIQPTRPRHHAPDYVCPACGANCGPAVTTCFVCT